MSRDKAMLTPLGRAPGSADRTRYLDGRRGVAPNGIGAEESRGGD